MARTAIEVEALLMPAEVAALFRVDAKTVTRWAKAGKLTSIRTIGGHRRYREREIRALLNGDGGTRIQKITVTAAHIVNGDIRVANRHPLALAISEAINGTVRVTLGSPNVAFATAIIPLPNEAAALKRNLESGVPVAPVTFMMQVPA